MLQDINPDAACMCTKYIGRREKAVLNLIKIGTKGKSFAHHTSAV